MDIIVPLAGPDFELPDGSTKAEMLIEGRPLLLTTLTSRSWWRRGEVAAENLIFVLRDTSFSRNFANNHLSTWFPGARSIFLSHATAGAAFSALAGITLCGSPRPLCIDLADILFDDDLEPTARFYADPTLGGIIPVFASDRPQYSYAVLSSDGRVLRTAEKKVISNLASAGTYFFKDASVYLEALSKILRHNEKYSYNGAFFVCPVFNGVIESGLDVRSHAVTDILDIKQAFIVT